MPDGIEVFWHTGQIAIVVLPIELPSLVVSGWVIAESDMHGTLRWYLTPRAEYELRKLGLDSDTTGQLGWPNG